MTVKRKIVPIHGFKAVGDEADGVFEAYVSVFGNVDLGGDRVVPGAFAASLDRWAEKGDPIPVIWSHQWDDLDAHVGKVLDAEEREAGDDRLPEEISDLGGLWVKMGLDVDEDFAGRLAKRMTDRRITQFSFAYDTIDERKATDGANELVELDVLEVGPCLLGMNPLTVLASKARAERWSASKVLDEIDAIAGHAPAAKATVTFSGSIEEQLQAYYQAALDWATEGDGQGSANGGVYAVHMEATYPAEERAIVLVEGWEDPVGEGIYYELSYAVDADGRRTVEEAQAVTVEGVVTPKARRKALALAARAEAGSPAKAAEGATVPGHTEASANTKANTEEPSGANVDEPGGKSGNGASEATRALIEAEALALA